MNSSRNDDEPSAGQGEADGRRQPWTPMKLDYLGQVRELVQGGEAKKHTVTQGDPGEPSKKPPGQPI